MRDLRLADILRAQHGIVSYGQLRALGWSDGAIRHRVRRGRLFRILRAVYAISPVLSEWGWRAAAVAAVDGGDGTAVLSHRSALSAHGASDAVGRPIRTQHVTRVGTGRRDPGSVIVHRARAIPADDAVVLHGVRVTTVARAVLDIAIRDTVPRTRRLIRDLQFSGHLGDEELAIACERHPTHPGRRTVRVADPVSFEWSDAATPLHNRVRRFLHGLDLPAFVEELPLTGHSGAEYRADFAFPSLWLIVEADGGPGHATPTAARLDRLRDVDLRAAGWETFRITSLDLDVRERDRTVQMLRALVEARGR